MPQEERQALKQRLHCGKNMELKLLGPPCDAIVPEKNFPLDLHKGKWQLYLNMYLFYTHRTHEQLMKYPSIISVS